MWVLAAVVLAGAILTEQAARGPLDDPQPARQRPGILTPAAISPPAVEVGDDSPTPGFRTVVFFLRDGQYPALVQALQRWDFLGQGGRTSPVDLLSVSAREPEGKGVITPDGSDPTGSIARPSPEAVGGKIAGPGISGSRRTQALMSHKRRRTRVGDATGFAADPGVGREAQPIEASRDPVRW